MTITYLSINTLYICICIFVYLRTKAKEDKESVVIVHSTLVSCIVFAILTYGNIILTAIFQQEDAIIGGLVICWVISYLVAFLLKKIALRKNKGDKI